MVKVGRPRKYETPEALQEAIDAYFARIEQEGEKPTIAGMCYDLGFEDRHALAEYANYDGFSATIKRARMRVERFLEQSLYAGQVTGIIFNLKNNFGWQDKQVREHEIPKEVLKSLWGLD